MRSQLFEKETCLSTWTESCFFFLQFFFFGCCSFFMVVPSVLNSEVFGKRERGMELCIVCRVVRSLTDEST